MTVEGFNHFTYIPPLEHSIQKFLPDIAKVSFNAYQNCFYGTGIGTVVGLLTGAYILYLGKKDKDRSADLSYGILAISAVFGLSAAGAFGGACFGIAKDIYAVARTVLQ